MRALRPRFLQQMMGTVPKSILPTQRLAALFLLAVFGVSILAQPASVFAADVLNHGPDPAVVNAHQNTPPDANKPMAQNYPGAKDPAQPAFAAASDARQGGTGLFRASALIGEPTQSGQPKTIQPRELVDKRTAMSDTKLNKDGT